jgi:hypothetical protein
MISSDPTFEIIRAYNSAGCKYTGPGFSSSTAICFFVIEDRRLLTGTTGEGGAADDLVVRGDLEGPAPGEDVAGCTSRRRCGVIGEGGVCVFMSADDSGNVLVPAIDVDIMYDS